MRTQLQIRTEYSFRYAYGHIKKVVTRLKELGCTAAAITDRNSTFGHIPWDKHCKEAGIKPLFGCEFAFIENATVKEKRQKLFYLPIVARTNSGLREIYAAMEEATSQFHYVPRLSFSKLEDFSQDVIILSGTTGLGQGFCGKLPGYSSGNPATASHLLLNGNIVAVSDNYMIRATDRPAYEILAAKNRNDRPSPMHILDEWELRNEIDLDDEAFLLADRLAEECDAKIQMAANIKYRTNQSLLELCIIGAQERRLELNDEYTARMHYELNLIDEKDFTDYFYVIHDMVKYAKQNMVVGPARGSSCGSLVCYLLGITDIDPIPHGLIFERFIDVTRSDLPDIDIDFQDNKREMVFEYVQEKYGQENVARLGTVLRYKPKSAISDAAKALQIPDWETKSVKDSILKRSGGDSRATFCILDTFEELEIGQQFIKKYPAMKIAGDLEGHAHYTGKHAAAVVITDKPLINYVSKDVRTNTVHLDKFDIEHINLLKIDALGLKTLSIIADCLKAIGWTYDDLLNHPLDDDKAFEVLRKFQFCGIFQYEGQALQTLARRVHIDRFDDVSALTALARPGTFASGASNEWVQRRMGRQEVSHIHPVTEAITGSTYGLIVYQEQVMKIVREVGHLSWEDTSLIRKAMSKSLGVEYFDRYWIKFRAGALEHGFDEETARRIWDAINTMGSWCFNKSHAVAYGMLSYYCCILKGHYPIEFALAVIRNTGDVNSIKRYLRELDRAGFEVKSYDPIHSEAGWSYNNNQFLGGLTNIKGIGPKKAERILLAPPGNRPFMLPNPIVTPYDNLFEGRTRFADLMENPRKYNIIHHKRTDLIDIDDDYEGQVVFIAKLVHRNERSLNETMFLVQRNNVKVPNDKWLNVILEDDTSTVYAVISRFKYPSLGVMMLNKYSLGSWFIFGGMARNGRRVYIDKFKFIGEPS
jgi:DNA polymerase III alpha subunit